MHPSTLIRRETRQPVLAITLSRIRPTVQYGGNKDLSIATARVGGATGLSCTTASIRLLVLRSAGHYRAYGPLNIVCTV